MTKSNNKKITLDAKFFREYPLYRKLKIELPEMYGSPVGRTIELPGIHLFCPVCNSENTFVGNLTIGDRHRDQLPPASHPGIVAGKSGAVTYRCASCRDYHQFYFLYFDLNLSYIMKIGQYPAWSISVERHLEEILGIYKSTYHKGLVCESQGYGIGAYAYYRRIVENIIDKLLDLVSELLEDEEDVEAYQKALDQTRRSTVAKDKIVLVKDLLPKSLRPDNMNPLSILYDNLSAGIHAQTDEECLEIAGSIREILTFLVERINLAREDKESAQSFTENMRRLLDKRNQ